MTELSGSGSAQRRREDRRKRAADMVMHLRREVLLVPGRRAAVRSALGHEPGSPRTFRAYREISAFLTPELPKREEEAFLAVAAMMCAQPASNRKQDVTAADANEKESRRTRTLGGSCALAVNRSEITEKSVEARLHQLCRGDSRGLHRQLPRLVHHLRGVGVEVEWTHLVDDLTRWDIDRERIAAGWLREFYQGLTARSTTQKTNPEDDASQEDQA
ncbi:type I-E CRISPR-associated protein Cse2/CasB [Saccharopolyspora sp. NPDC047091]|uniref:type I-E CRISPR-associated protein Cse2/CasB n=1 Tax=Saccharopolyspora sp. NPDC047091 TaxID=3155924 RepID=UPI0033FEE220